MQTLHFISAAPFSYFWRFASQCKEASVDWHVGTYCTSRHKAMRRALSSSNDQKAVAPLALEDAAAPKLEPEPEQDHRQPPRLSSSDVSNLVRNYSEFFDHISLRKGWRTVPFALDDVHRHFAAAAPIVVLTRAELSACVIAWSCPFF